ncbi:MAG: LPS assembly lipoprotein LptE [Elusimicrobiota bacterium]
MNGRSLAFAALVAAFAACSSGPDIGYRPAPQLLPANIQKLAMHPLVNKTEQFGLEDKLALAVRDHFLGDTRYPLVPEEEADGVLWITITRYILTPLTFDATLAPTSYKLTIIVDAQMVDQSKKQTLWDERNLRGDLTFQNQNLPGGITEEQARENIWAILAPKIVTRTIDGFGAVTGSSQRIISGDAPSTAPAAQPEKPLAPVVPAPY